MSRIAHLFAVPLTLVSTDDLNSNGKSNSNKTNGATAKDKVSGTTLECKKSGEMKPKCEVNNETTKRKKKNKKKNQIWAAPVRTYIDYDKNLDDNNQPALWMWQGTTHGTGGGQEVTPDTSTVSPCAQREVVSYQELAQSQNLPRNLNEHRNGCQLKNGPPGIKNGCLSLVQKNPNFLSGQQNKQNPSLLSNGQFLKRKAKQHQHPKKIARMNTPVNNTNRNDVNGNGTSSSSSLPIALANNFIDPLVAATEKKELFQKPQPVVANNGRKPLTSKQRKRIEKAKFYKEKMRLQMEKEKERISSLKQLPCRYFSNGNCTKGDECPYNHEFLPQKKPELCKFYMISFCEKGPSCLYYHNDWPCKFFHRYRSCSQGDRCRFSHQPLTDETRQLLEKSLNENSHPGVPVAGMSVPPESPRIPDAKAHGPFSFFGTSNAHQHPPGIQFRMPHHGFHQPWSVKLEPVDVDDSFWLYIPSDASVDDPRIKERLLRKNEPVGYVAPHKRDPLALLECPRFACFSLDVQDSSSRPALDKISVDCDSGVTVNSDYFEPKSAVAEETTQGLVLPSESSSLNLVCTKDGVPEEVKTARHLSLPIMQVVARGTADKFTRLKRGNGVLAPDSPNLPSASS